MKTSELDLVPGQTVTMRGHSCLVRYIDEEGCTLEYPDGKLIWEEADDILAQNEDILI